MRIITYNQVRKLHLYTAFVLLLFVLMYFVTGFILSHEHWFTHSEPEVDIKQMPLHVPGELSVEDLSVYLQKQFNIHAKREKPETKSDGTINFSYFKPGRIYTVKVSPDKTIATLTSKKLPAVRTFIGFHRMARYGGGFLYNIYILMMDLASIATILFSLTGIYLWYKLIKKKTVGLILLSVSVGYTAVVVYLFMNG